MTGKSEERKIAEGQTREQARQFDLQLQQQLAQLRGQQLGQEEALQRAQPVTYTHLTLPTNNTL